MYKLRTIDVWDTLLRRNCHPECIKLATAHHFLLGWRNQIRPEFCDSWVLYRARLNVERALAVQAKDSGKDDEYEITQVLTQWVTTAFINTAPSILPVRLAEFELSVEVAQSYVDPEIFDFLDTHEAEKTLFLSDFYMSAKMLSSLLASKGLDTLVYEGLSSCDVGLNKRSGQIFRHLHSIYAISPHEHVHIGDNEWSDVSSPRALGVKTLHYLPQSGHAKRLMHEQLFINRDVLFNHIFEGCVPLVQNINKDLSAKQTAALSLGMQAAPLFIGFSLWIAEQAVIQKLDRLCFLTREGEFFHKVFSVMYSQGQLFGHTLPPNNILEVSRLSTFAPSMKDVSIQEMSRIWSLFKVQSVAGLFTTLGLDIRRFSQLLEELNLKETDVIDDPKNSLELLQLLQAPVFTEAAKSSIVSQANLLQRYLKESGINSGDRIGIVDIGWRGTIQDSISLMMPETNFHGMYLGLRRLINAQPSNTSKAAYVADENITNASNSIFMNFGAMELLCTSPNGSVVGYTIKNSCVRACRHIDQAENTSYRDFVEAFQKGVLLAAQHWQPYLERYVVSSNELHAMALRVWDKLRRTPDEGLVEAYLQTPQQDLFGYGDIFRRSQYPSLSTIFLSPLIASRKRELIEFIRRVQWSEAIENAKDIGIFHRTLLLFAFRAAHLVKRVALQLRLARRSNDA